MYLNDEQKKVLTAFNDLMPWDRGNLLYCIAMTMPGAEIEKYFLDELGYCKYDDIDVVKEVIDNGYETDVLDEMTDYDICDYLLNTPDPADNVRYMFDALYKEDQATMISDLSDDDIVSIFDTIKEGHPKAYETIVKHIAGIK